MQHESLGEDKDANWHAFSAPALAAAVGSVMHALGYVYNRGGAQIRSKRSDFVGGVDLQPQ